MHRPGRPEDLEAPDRLWARAATLAVIAAAGGPEGLQLGPAGVQYWSPGGAYWWQLTLAAGGEAVLSGQDSDASHTHLQPDRLDLLAGMPERLVWDGLRRDHRDLVLGYVYWYTGGAWHRVPYPDGVEDDGLAFSTRYIAGDAGVLEALAETLDRDDDELDAAAAAFLERAHARTVDAASVANLVGALAEQPSDEQAQRVAARLGLTGAQSPPMLGDGSATQQL